MMLTPYQGLQNSSSVAEGGPLNQSLSTSPPPYDRYNITNSDIYGRIGMTRQVQVGGTLPAGFGRNQKNYSSLPPNLRQPLNHHSDIPSTQSNKQLNNENNVLRQNKNYSAKSLTRRASVAGTETNKCSKSGASNSQDKSVDSKEKSSKKDKEKKKKDPKTEKSPKKKLFWTLPLRRKKKSKDDGSSEEDDGGFKDATLKPTRRLVLASEDASFVRYPSPDTGSSDLNSSHSSDMSSGDHGYRSSPSSEVCYYSQKAKALARSNQSIPPISATSNVGVIPSLSTSQNTLSIPNNRSHPSTPVSPSDPQIMMALENSEMTDIARNRGRYMTREDMYAAMRHPQYYNMNRQTLAGMPPELNLNTTPTSSRSNSPAVFGVSPLPSYTVRPQVRETVVGGPNEVSVPAVSQSYIVDPREQALAYLSDSNEGSGNKYDFNPASGYREVLSNSFPVMPVEEEGWSSSAPGSNKCAASTKQTTLLDFKKMILDESMKSAGGKERVSAVEMLKASRPSIYGYYLPPVPMVVKPETATTPTTVPMSKAEGIIMPPNSRNTARALLFQSRFGSGRRYRSPKTEIISTTILEDKVEEELHAEEWDNDSDCSEEYSSGTASSQEKRIIPTTTTTTNSSKRLGTTNSKDSLEQRGGVSKGIKSIPDSSQNSTCNGNNLHTSTPIKPHTITPFTVPSDVSIILTYAEDPEVENEAANTASPPGSTPETSL